jgi:hypothetical protein
MFRFPSLFPSTGRLAPLAVKLPDGTNGWPNAGLLLPDIERLSPDRALGGGGQSVSARTKVTLDKRVSGEETVGLFLNCSRPATDHWRVDDPLVRSLLIEGIGRPDQSCIGLDGHCQLNRWRNIEGNRWCDGKVSR